MNIRVRIDAKEVQRRMGDLARRSPRAVANAINKTAEDFQKEQRRVMRTAFTVRRPAFVDRAIKIKPFARSGSLSATVSVDPPGGQARASILTQHETAGQKRARDGGRVAVPIHARTNKAGIPQRIRQLGLKPDEHGRIVGRNRTFMVKKGGKVTILQRTGRGKNAGVRVLYTLKRSVPLKARLQFHKTAQRVVRQRLQPNLTAGIREAIEHARKA